MTKEITKSIILQEIADKFALRDFEPEKFLFGEYVIPTYDIAPHVRNWVNTRHRIEVTGNGSYQILYVPATERYHVRRMSLLHETGANFDIDQVLIAGLSGSVQYLFYDTVAPITSGTVKIFEFIQDIPMQQGSLWEMMFNVSNFVTGGYVATHVLNEEEILR